jgi:hypothetical protein
MMQGYGNALVAGGVCFEDDVAADLMYLAVAPSPAEVFDEI